MRKTAVNKNHKVPDPYYYAAHKKVILNLADVNAAEIIQVDKKHEELHKMVR